MVLLSFNSKLADLVLSSKDYKNINSKILETIEATETTSDNIPPNFNNKQADLVPADIK